MMTDFYKAPFGSTDLEMINFQTTGVKTLCNTTAKSLINNYFIPYSNGYGTLTIPDLYNVYLADGDGALNGTLYELTIERPTAGSAGNYQVTLLGNGSGTGIWFDSADRLYSDGTNLTSAAPFLALDKIKFTQTDGNEYIDSLNTGYMDYGATTAHRFNNLITTHNVEPITDDTYYVGRNDDDSPKAYKGIILADTTDGKYYRIEITSGSIVVTDLTD
jgi:hypothetical protein